MKNNPKDAPAKERSFEERMEKTWEEFSDAVEEQWDDVCDWVELHGKEYGGVYVSQHFLRRLTVESPVVICFCFLCTAIHVINVCLTAGWLARFLAVPDTFAPFSVLQYPRLVTHVFAHDMGVAHLKGNMVHLLLVGPSAEHVYGSQAMLVIFALVAVSSAVAHIVVGSNYTHQMGASGIVFSTILLNSLVAADVGTIPVSFVLTAGLWLTDEVVKFLWKTDNVSHHAHLTGAIVGTAAGYWLKGHEAKKRKLASMPGIGASSQSRSATGTTRSIGRAQHQSPSSKWWSMPLKPKTK